MYGTNKQKVIEKLSIGKNVLFDIDWQGTKLIKKKKLKYKLISFFILPPSKKALKDRLSNRDMKDKLIVEERMSQFKNDLMHWKDYHYVVINNNLKACYKKITKIIKLEKNNKKFKYNRETIKKKINRLVS